RGGSVTRIALIRACSLRPDSLASFRERYTPQQVADIQNVNTWFQLYTRGLGHFSAGRFDEAIRHFRQSLPTRSNYPAKAVDHPVLAMALYKCGQIDAARQELDRSRTERNRWIQSSLQAGARPVPWEFWYDWAEFLIFHAEAHRMVEGSPPPDD